MERIKSIFVHATNQGRLIYTVGKNGVTAIIECSVLDGNGMATNKMYYQVYRNKEHWIDIHQCIGVQYFLKDESQP